MKILMWTHEDKEPVVALDETPGVPVKGTLVGELILPGLDEALF